jgi:hypothetical protein
LLHNRKRLSADSARWHGSAPPEETVSIVSRSWEITVIAPSVSSLVAYTTPAVGCAVSHDGESSASSRSGVNVPSSLRRNVLIPVPLPPVADV